MVRYSVECISPLFVHRSSQDLNIAILRIQKELSDLRLIGIEIDPKKLFGTYSFQNLLCVH